MRGWEDNIKMNLR